MWKRCCPASTTSKVILSFATGTNVVRSRGTGERPTYRCSQPSMQNLAVKMPSPSPGRSEKWNSDATRLSVSTAGKTQFSFQVMKACGGTGWGKSSSGATMTVSSARVPLHTKRLVEKQRRLG